MYPFPESVVVNPVDSSQKFSAHLIVMSCKPSSPLASGCKTRKQMPSRGFSGLAANWVDPSCHSRRCRFSHAGVWTASSFFLAASEVLSELPRPNAWHYYFVRGETVKSSTPSRMKDRDMESGFTFVRSLIFLQSITDSFELSLIMTEIRIPCRSVYRCVLWTGTLALHSSTTYVLRQDSVPGAIMDSNGLRTPGPIRT